MGELVQLNLTATITDVLLMLVAVFVAGLLGAPIMWIGYAITGVVIIGVVDIAYRLRRAVGYILGMKLGTIQRENAELRQTVTEAHREQLQASRVVHSLSQRNVESVTPVTVTHNYVAADNGGYHQQCIAHALLIFDTKMQGQPTSREAMCPGKMSHDEWHTGKEWLIGAGVVEYVNKRKVVWHTTVRETARGKLLLYSKGVKV